MKLSAVGEKKSEPAERARRRDDTLPFALSHSEAIAAVIVGSVAVDGVLRTEEAERLHEVLSSTRWVLGTGVEATARVTKHALDLITEYGLPAVLDACAKAIPPEWHPTAFALAIDVMLADGRLGSRESALIDRLQNVLRLDDSLARRIVEVLVIKNRASGRPDL